MLSCHPKRVGRWAWAVVLLLAACRPPEETTLSILFTGDVLLDRGVRQQIESRGVDSLFSSVSPLFHAMDATVVNLECPLTAHHTPIQKRYIFRAEPVWAKALARAGITHAALANNHSMDQGRSGLADTYQCLSNAGITPIGYGRNAAESARPILIRKGHIRVALFNSVLLPLENWVYLDGEPGICQLPADALAEAIGQYKRTHPDTYVVVILHWGMEYQASPTLSQRMGAHKLVAAGADAVVGHHPHVVQPEEYIDGRPVFYSLGNFVFDQRKPETSQSLLVQLDFTDKGISVKQHWATIRQCKPILKTSQPPPAPSVRRESSPVHRESAGDDPFALAITAWVPYLCWR